MSIVSESYENGMRIIWDPIRIVWESYENHITVRKNTRYSKRKLEWKNVAKLSNMMIKGCQITKKIKSFPDRILQKSTRSSQEQNGCERSKLNQIEKPTPLWKTNFLRCTTLPFNPKLYVNSEGGNKHFVFFQLR